MITDKIGVPNAIEFIEKKLKVYDLSQLEWIKLTPYTGGRVVKGITKYPCRLAPRSRTFTSQYRINANINPAVKFPATFDHWARIPNSSAKQGWLSGPYTYRVENLEEAAIHLLAHEIFHFLSHSNQVPEKNVEANANWFADLWLKEWRDLHHQTQGSV